MADVSVPTTPTNPDGDAEFKETARNLNPDAEIQGNEHVPGVEVVKAAMDQHPFPTPTRVLATSAVEALIRAGWHSPRMTAAQAPVLEGLRAEIERTRADIERMTRACAVLIVDANQQRESRIAWALEADRLQQIADNAVLPVDAVQQLVNAAEGVQGIKEQHASEELADMFRAVLRSWQAQPASDPWTAPIKGNVDVRPSASDECDCYPKLHASYPNAKAYVCPTCGSQWAPMMDGHGRWLWLHKPAPTSDPDDDPLDNMPLGILAATDPKRYVAAPSSVQGDTTPEEA